jgi:hypothetical protein
MDAEFRRGEQVHTTSWKCICGKVLTEHDEVYYVDADEAPTTLGDIDDVGVAELMCSRECCRIYRASLAEDRMNAERDCDDGWYPIHDFDDGRWDDDPNPYDGTYSEE